MQQRKASPDELDYYPTPPWGTRALCNFLEGVFYARAHALEDMSVWEPACGEGYMSRPLGEYFKRVVATDLQDFSARFPDQARQEDFLLDWGAPDETYDWIITNPPFVQGQAFVERSLRLAKKGVAMLVRLAFLETIERYHKLLKPSPPSIILQFVERLPMEKGKCRKEAVSATAYCWLIWDLEVTDETDVQMGTRFHWIPPGTRAEMELVEDYPQWGVEKVELPLFESGKI